MPHTFAQTLKSGERLLSVPLLNSNVDVILLRTDGFGFS